MMVILGGMGTLFGPVLGAFALVLLQEVFADLTKHWLLADGRLRRFGGCWFYRAGSAAGCRLSTAK